ncbi:MAG: HD domain-containing protein [Eubacteriales bacterium]|nr:HD domain-containing protein [Eubacteriales bacterium]
MDGIIVKRENVDFLRNGDESGLALLLEHSNTEIMVQKIHKNSLVWITPADEKDMVEFFYIVEGEVSLETSNETIHLKENDCFYTNRLEHEVLLRSHMDLKIFYVSTRPIYNNLDSFNNDLNELLTRIDEKDRYTKQHCSRVADLCTLISKKLDCAEKVLNNLVIAALFHDVGKCFIPAQILEKKTKLTQEEFREIYKHPSNSKKILKDKFSEEICDIAQTHHERLDGSGYPYGLSGTDISLEARIIGVADSFDAMTTKRPYNDPKTYEDAAIELCEMSDKYDSRVSDALKELVLSGEFHKFLNEVEYDRD